MTDKDRLTQSDNHLATLSTLVQSAASELTLEEIYRLILADGRELLRAGVMRLFLRQDGELALAAEFLHPDLAPGHQRLSIDSSLAAEVWEAGTGQVSGSAIAVLVSWQDEAFGVLEASGSGNGSFTVEDGQLLQAIATWTAIAISNDQQRRLSEHRLRESEAIAAVSRSLSTTLEPQDILEMIVQTAHEMVPRSTWAIVHLLQGRPERLVPATWAGIGDQIRDYIISADEGAAGLALAEGRPVHVGDSQNDPLPSAYAHNVGLRSLLVAPLLSGNRQKGTITLHCHLPHAFTEEDERLLTILAVQAGMAIENSDLYDSQRRARLVAEMQRQRLRLLTDRLVSAQEEERLRISRELHDEAGQALTSLKISLDLLQSDLSADQDKLRTRLADLSALVGDTLNNLRTLAHDLRPPGLDVFGLNVALEGLCHDFSTRTGMNIGYKGEDFPELPVPVALSVYRLAQEALTNIAKHAKTKSASVELIHEFGALSLIIADEGRGFALNSEDHPGGFGLINMQERTDLLGGTLVIDTAPGMGTRIVARIPVEAHPDEATVRRGIS